MAKTAPTAPELEAARDGREDQERKNEPDGQPAQRPQQDEVPRQSLAGIGAYSAESVPRASRS